MELAWIALEKIAEMFLILLAGYLLSRCGLIDTETNRKLSNLLLMFVSPFLIFVSYQMDFSQELLTGWLQTLFFSILAFALTILATRFVIPGSSRYDKSLERISVIYSNCGYIGLPLLDALFGQQGVFYMTVYMTVFNVLAWTQGVMLLDSKREFRQMAKNLCSPMIIGVALGALCFFCQIRLPESLLNPMTSIGNMNTPLAMLIAGASLAEADLLQMLRKGRLYLISAIKLLFCPLLFLATAIWFPFGNLPLTTVFLGAACPSGTLATLFALRYGRDNAYATELLAISTVLSILTIPLMILIKDLLQGLL